MHVTQCRPLPGRHSCRSTNVSVPAAVLACKCHDQRIALSMRATQASPKHMQAGIMQSIQERKHYQLPNVPECHASRQGTQTPVSGWREVLSPLAAHARPDTDWLALLLLHLVREVNLPALALLGRPAAGGASQHQLAPAACLRQQRPR
jgi:hypothetical protein